MKGLHITPRLYIIYYQSPHTSRLLVVTTNKFKILFPCDFVVHIQKFGVNRGKSVITNKSVINNSGYTTPHHHVPLYLLPGQFKILSALNECVFLTLRAIYGYGQELLPVISYYCSFTEVSPYIRSINVRIQPLLCNPTYNHVSVSLQLLPSLVFNYFMTTLAYKVTMCITS